MQPGELAMCGIAGIVTPGEAAPGIGERFVASLQHRGPDGSGAKQVSGGGLHVLLAHTRLAILDLSAAGNQPMCDPVTGNHIAFNGEIFNFRDLRNQLGGEWRSESDTEVILRAYDQWGDAAFGRLRGMFALALWDAKRGRLCLARDPHGIKPLYWTGSGVSFAFASEVRALLDADLVPRKLSAGGLQSYLRFGSVQEPETLIDGVHSVLPGHVLTVSADADKMDIAQKTLDSATARAPFADRREAVAALRSALEDSVRAHLVSDVPVAAFLSGGIDSSAIVALMSRALGHAPHTFTVIFEEPEFSEHHFARRIADEYRTIHTEIPLAESDLLAMLPDALSAMDQPTMDGVNTYVVSRAVHNAGVKVALSGLGGDELFAGYPSFRRAVRSRQLARVPRAFRRAAAAMAGSAINDSVAGRKAQRFLGEASTPWDAYVITRELFAPDEITRLLGSPVAADAASPEETGDPVNDMSRYEMQGYMTSTLLRDTDQMSMAHALEVRVPFIDREVISLVMSIPGRWKIDGARPKPLLLDALASLLPAEVTNRKKMGFTLPFERWMQSSLKQEIDGAFAGGSATRLGLGGYAAETWRTFRDQPRREKWARPWALYALLTWCEHHRVSG